jgi:hypothetical protein
LRWSVGGRRRPQDNLGVLEPCGIQNFLRVLVGQGLEEIVERHGRAGLRVYLGEVFHAA